MYHIGLMVMCAAMVHGHKTFDWEKAIRKTYTAWNKADNSQNINGMTALVSDDTTFYPPGSPPVRGKHALTQFYKQILKSGQWPQKKILTFGKIIAECDDLAVAEHSASMIMFDGKIYQGSGLWVFTRKGDEVKLLAVSWNADAPLIDPNEEKTTMSTTTRQMRPTYHRGPPNYQYFNQGPKPFDKLYRKFYKSSFTPTWG